MSDTTAQRFSQLVSHEMLQQISDSLIEETIERINAFKEERELQIPASDPLLQQGADVRAVELVDQPNHTRPDGTLGMDAPYEFGYDKDKVTQGEIIGEISRDSLKWLIQHASEAIFNSLLTSNIEFLEMDNLIEQALGIALVETPEDYQISFVYLASQEVVIEETPQPVPFEVSFNTGESEGYFTSPQGGEVDKSKLRYYYNDYLSKDMIDMNSPYFERFTETKSRAKRVYKDEHATQEDVDKITAELKQVEDLIFADDRL